MYDFFLDIFWYSIRNARQQIAVCLSRLMELISWRNSRKSKRRTR